MNASNRHAGRTAYDANRAALSAPLVREYLIELLSDFESLAASTREAVYRENDNLARIHLDHISSHRPRNHARGERTAKRGWCAPWLGAIAQAEPRAAGHRLPRTSASASRRRDADHGLGYGLTTCKA